MKRMQCSAVHFPVPILIIFCFITIFLVPVSPASDEKVHNRRGDAMPVPGAVGLDDKGHMHISPQDRCPVCAMIPANSAKFAAAIELEDGRTYYFCGTGCMIRSWMHPEIFLNADKNQLKRNVVREYMGGEFVSGKDAIWAAGSDVMGPMGPALVPLKTEADLEAFKKRHGAKTTFRLDEMDDRMWEKVTGKKALK